MPRALWKAPSPRQNPADKPACHSPRSGTLLDAFGLSCARSLPPAAAGWPCPSRHLTQQQQQQQCVAFQIQPGTRAAAASQSFHEAKHCWIGAVQGPMRAARVTLGAPGATSRPAGSGLAAGWCIDFSAIKVFLCRYWAGTGRLTLGDSISASVMLERGASVAVLHCAYIRALIRVCVNAKLRRNCDRDRSPRASAPAENAGLCHALCRVFSWYLLAPPVFSFRLRTVCSGLAAKPKEAGYPQLTTRFPCLRASIHPPSRPGHPCARTAHPRGRRTPPASFVECAGRQRMLLRSRRFRHRPTRQPVSLILSTHAHTTATSPLTPHPHTHADCNTPPKHHHMILALLKSISGWAAINFFRISCSSTTPAHSRSAQHNTAQHTRTPCLLPCT